MTTTPTTAVDDAVLDNAAWHSLTGRHAHLAEGNDLPASCCTRQR